MKKKLSLVLGTILALSLCLLTACGGDPAPEGAYDNDELEMSMVFFEDVRFPTIMTRRSASSRWTATS